MKLGRNMVAGQKLATQALNITRAEKPLFFAGRLFWTPQEREDNKQGRITAIEFVMMSGTRHDGLALRYIKLL